MAKAVVYRPASFPEFPWVTSLSAAFLSSQVALKNPAARLEEGTHPFTHTHTLQWEVGGGCAGVSKGAAGKTQRLCLVRLSRRRTTTTRTRTRTRTSRLPLSALGRIWDDSRTERDRGSSIQALCPWVSRLPCLERGGARNRVSPPLALHRKSETLCVRR